MNGPKGSGSVVPLPPDDQQRKALEAAAELTEPSSECRGRVIERLAQADAQVMRRRRQRRLRYGFAAGAAAAAVLALATLWPLGRPEGGVPTGPESILPTRLASGYAQVQAVSPCEGVHVEARELTTVEMDWCESGVLCIGLERGEIDVSVGPAFKPQILRVHAGSVVVQVVGTRFTVSRHADRVSVAVTEGTVSVAWPEGSDTVTAGSSWRSWADPADTLAAAPDGQERRDELRADEDHAPPPPAPPQAPTESPPQVALAETEIQLLATIQAQRGLGRPADERLGALDRFLATYPASASAEEVMALKVEALTDAGAYRDAIDTARDYCLTHESGPRREEVRWLEATVARDRLHDCELALAPYRELAESSAARRGEAQYYRGMCAFDTGRTDEARAALEAALAHELPAQQQQVARQILESLDE